MDTERPTALSSCIALRDTIDTTMQLTENIISDHPETSPRLEQIIRWLEVNLEAVHFFIIRQELHPQPHDGHVIGYFQDYQAVMQRVHDRIKLAQDMCRVMGPHLTGEELFLLNGDDMRKDHMRSLCYAQRLRSPLEIYAAEQLDLLCKMVGDLTRSSGRDQRNLATDLTKRAEEQERIWSELRRLRQVVSSLTTELFARDRPALAPGEQEGYRRRSTPW